MLVTAATMTGQTAATTVVVADGVTRQPVARASLYTKEGGHFHSCISNEQGIAKVSFPFHRLTVSHLSYERRQLSRLSDTIFLQPKYQSTAEVVITNKEPEWIRRCLKQVVKLKEKHYFSHEGCERYDYHTQSISTNHLYRLRMAGLLQMRSASQKHYAITVDSAAIVCVDSTRLTDTSNLRRMLYEDFMVDLDNGFIRAHRFYHNADYEGNSPHEVELRFRSKKEVGDRGRIIVDTLRHVVLSAQWFTGTKSNLKERINNAMYAMARVFGYRIDTWTRDYHVSYAQRPDSTLYPAEIRYKMYFAGHDGDNTSRQEEFNKQTGGGFPNMEATLTLQPSTVIPSPSALHDLPPSWYIAFHSDSEREQEIALSSLPASFTIFENEP